MQEDDHFLSVCRYVERNPLRAGLVARAEAWRWGSLWQRDHDTEPARPALSAWPVPIPRRWQRLVNEPQTAAEEEALRRCVRRGNAIWQEQTAARLGLETTFRARGRPRKAAEKGAAGSARRSRAAPPTDPDVRN